MDTKVLTAVQDIVPGDKVLVPDNDDYDLVGEADERTGHWERVVYDYRCIPSAGKCRIATVSSFDGSTHMFHHSMDPSDKVWKYVEPETPTETLLREVREMRAEIAELKEKKK